MEGRQSSGQDEAVTSAFKFSEKWPIQPDMSYTVEQLDLIYQRTSGKCHLCHDPLARSNYARFGERGAWEVEHSVPRARGGTDRLNNLYAAHICCNRSKCVVTILIAAAYEYGPFGQVIRASGDAARENAFRFSTKYEDDESGMVYYGLRYYKRETGGWLSRDPANEYGGVNLYTFLANSPANSVDPLGLWGKKQHYDIIDRWLSDNAAAGGRDWKHYAWHCLNLNVPFWLQNGNDDVDGTGSATLKVLCDAQSSENSYQHGMHAWYETKATAQSKYNKFIDDQINLAKAARDIARNLVKLGHYDSATDQMQKAIYLVGKAQHPVADTTSPPHADFAMWIGPREGVIGLPAYILFVGDHMLAETKSVYDKKGNGPANDVAAKMHSKLLEVMKE